MFNIQNQWYSAEKCIKISSISWKIRDIMNLKEDIVQKANNKHKIKLQH